MIRTPLLAVLLQAATPASPPSPPPAASPPTLSPLSRQALPARGCAAYLWSVADRSFVAVAGTSPAALRIKAGGQVVDLPRVAMEGQDDLGPPAVSAYEGAGWSATLTLTIARRDDLAGGAIVSAATLTLRRAGSDELVMPLGGLIGCAPAP